jgi:hypothetical protein
MKFAFICFAFFIASLANNYTSFAQNVKDEPFIAESNDSGELTIAYIEDIVRDAKKGERVFVISRLGAGETERLNNVRLRTTQWKLSTMGLNPPQILIAKGEPTKGEGRIEFYLGSHLRLVILAKRNQMPNLTCCEDYLPPVKRSHKKRKTKKH